MYDLKDIVFESGKYWILDAGEEYQLFKTGITVSTRIGIVSKKLGLERAIINLKVIHMGEQI